MIEFIGHCNSNGKKGLILAFDSLSISTSINIVSECYKLFGFGSVFINMLKTVGRNRKVSIILDNGELS